MLKSGLKCATNPHPRFGVLINVLFYNKYASITTTYTILLQRVAVALFQLKVLVLDGENTRGRENHSYIIGGMGGSDEHELNINTNDTRMALKENIF